MPAVSPPPEAVTTTTSGVRPSAARSSHDLAADRALAGDHQRIVVGRHQRRRCGVRRCRARSPRDPRARDRRARPRRRAPRCARAWARRIRRHDDDRRHAEDARRRRHALRMIAGREGHHAAGALVHRDRRQLVVGAAELERAGALQGLGLEEHARAGERVEHRRRHQRRVQGDVREGAGRGIDIGGGRQTRCRTMDAMTKR